MALIEQDREDLFRDGSAMRVRGEATIDGTLWLFGFRSQGQATLYAGPDHVFQFNADGQLRRIFLLGQRYVTSNGRLKVLQLHSRGERLKLSSYLVEDHEQQRLLSQLDELLLTLKHGIADPSIVWKTEGIDVDGFRERVVKWLASLATPVPIANIVNA